ncbi:MAG: hypothetical protein ACW967_10460 [Candidatus Hodarchaeales archaeon]|jgi:predicted transcriptional regulator
MSNFQFKQLFLPIFVLFCFITSLHSVSFVVDEVSGTNNVLIIYNNTFDHSIAIEIQSQCPDGNYTLVSTNNISGLSNYIQNADLTKYNTLFLIVGSSLNEIPQNVIEKLQEYYDNDGSLAFISSKLWQLPSSAQELFGFLSPTGGFQEFVPNSFENFTLIVNNDTYLQDPLPYSIGSNVILASKLGMINKRSENVTEVMSSNTFDIGQNRTINSGIFLKLSSISNNLALSIPISLQNDFDNESVNLISSLSYYLIDWSITKSGENVDDSQTSPNTINFLNFSLSSSDAQTIAMIGGTLVIGVVSYKTLTVIRKKEDSVYEEGTDQSAIWSPEDSWITSILLFIFGLFASIGAIIYSQRYRRLTVFQVNENPIRQQIIEILDRNGFEHFNSLQKKLNTGVSILMWHLKVLEDFEIITMEKIGQYKVIYLFNQPPDPEEVLIYSKVRTRIAFDILNQFTKNFKWSLENLSQLLFTSQELVKYHCTKLVSLKILTYNSQDRAYTLDSKKISLILKLISRYRQNGQ